MIIALFSAVTLVAVLISTFVRSLRQAILSLWIAGLGIGAIYLTLGAELLAVLQWIMSTLVAISFVFFSVMFGEDDQPIEFKKNKFFLPGLLAPVLGLLFSAVIWLGVKKMNLAEFPAVKDGEVSSLATLGKMLANQHLLALEVLGLTLFLVLVGGGVIARPEPQNRQRGESS